nr:hypothetical protein [Escherichia coli]
MSQHWYEVKSNQGIVQVMLGWDPPLQWFHMCIDYDINAAEDPLYTNLAEPRQPGGCKLKTAPVRPVVAARPAEYVCSE